MILAAIGARMYDRSIPAQGDILCDSNLGADPHSGQDVFYTAIGRSVNNQCQKGGDAFFSSEIKTSGKLVGVSEDTPISLTCYSLVLLCGTGAGHKGNLVEEQR